MQLRTLDELKSMLVDMPKMTTRQYIENADEIILKSVHNMEVFSEMVVIAEDHLSDCEFDYETAISNEISRQRDAGVGVSTVEKIAKYNIVECDAHKDLLRAEKMLRLLKMRRDNAMSRYEACKKIKGG